MSKKIKRVKTQSGIDGWQDKLHKVYGNVFGEFLEYCEIFNLHTRLGFKTPKQAWAKNPTVQGSVNPFDLRTVK